MSDIQDRFKPREITATQYENIEKIRDRFVQLSGYLDIHLGDGRYKSLLMTSLEEAMEWASKANLQNSPVLDVNVESEQENGN